MPGIKNKVKMNPLCTPCIQSSVNEVVGKQKKAARLLHKILEFIVRKRIDFHDLLQVFLISSVIV